MLIDEVIVIHTSETENSVLLLKSQAFWKTGMHFIYLIGLNDPFMD